LTRILVYIEGPSDRLALEALLAPLLSRLRDVGTAVDFFDIAQGDRKKNLLLKVPERAVNILRSQPDVFVVAMPDLYPKNRGFPHLTAAELVAGIHERFHAAADRKNLVDRRLRERFRAFCFKHEMESLLLACPASLGRRLGVADLPTTWLSPVEDQDHDRPPKRVLEELFERHGQRYRDTVDAPLVLQGTDYQTVAAACPQCFAPFVQFLESFTS
jgi:Domain of unknown function (DUF4276)